MFLLVDTAFEIGLVGLFHNDKCLEEVKIPSISTLSNKLLPAIDTLLRRHSVKPQDLDFIAVGVGPGSYTGIRVAAMVAKTIAYSCQKPLVGVCSLTAFYAKLPGPFAVLIDARIAGAYLLKGTCSTNGEILFEQRPRILDLSDIKTIEGVECLVTSPQNKIQTRLLALSTARDWQWVLMEASLQEMGKQALSLYQKGRFSKDFTLELLYLRKTQAEIEAKDSCPDE